MRAEDRQCVERFLDSLSHLSAHTRAAYGRDLRGLIDYCEDQGLGGWGDLDTRRLLGFVAQRHRKGLSGRSLQRLLASVRALYRYLMKQGIAEGNPAAGVRAPKSPHALPKALYVDQAVHLVSVPPAVGSLAARDRAMTELLYSSGVRLSELVGLDMAHLDFADATVTVTGKGRKVRIVPMGRHAVAALKDWLKQRPSLMKDAAVEAVFVSQQGRRISPRNVQLRLRAQAKQQGLEGVVHPHMLRHSFASHLLQSSGELRAVQELLGHADISTTQVYTHLDFQHLAEVYDKAHPRARGKQGQSVSASARLSAAHPRARGKR